MDFEIIINKSQLDNLKFNLGHWYAKSRARALGLNDSMKNKFLACMEEPVALVTMQLLRNGIHAHFPNVNPNTDSVTISSSTRTISFLLLQSLLEQHAMNECSFIFTFFHA